MGLIFLNACSKSEKPEFPPPPEPQPHIEYPCPKEDDIYRLWPDTILVNSKEQLFSFDTNGEKLHDVLYDFSQFMLGTCTGKLEVRNEIINMPFAIKVKANNGQVSNLIPLNQGNIYLKTILSKQDITRITTLNNEEMEHYEIAILNFKRDTIQTNIVTFVNRPDFNTP